MSQLSYTHGYRRPADRGNQTAQPEGSAPTPRLLDMAFRSLAAQAITNLAGLRRIRGWRWLLAALAVYSAGHFLAPMLTQVFWMVTLLLWLVANSRLPGMLLAAGGNVCNLLAFLANGGKMPFIGEGSPDVFHSAADASTRLALLSDRWPVSWPVPSLFSLGDVLLIAGMLWLVSSSVLAAPSGNRIRPRPARPAPSSPARPS